jgi:membrane protein implicated in regulation of membrane protease activity
VFCAAIVVGVATLLLLAPVWLKIAHLLLANVLIIFGTVAFFRSTRDIPDRAFAEEVGDNR